jgi:cytochrome b
MVAQETSPMPLPPPRVPRLLMKVWDAPTRLFHWAVVLLVICSYVSNKLDRMTLHMLFGYTMLTLLLFRLAWGFIGSDTSRFSKFLTNPVEGLRHLARFARREPDTEIGHNAAGGWMVLLMLLDLGVQVGTGLFSNDDVLAKGPLAHLVSKKTSDAISQIHTINFYVLLGLIALHILAVLAYAVVKRQDLVRPMVTGKKRLPAATRQPRLASPALAVVVLACAAVLVWALVSLA